MIWGFTGLAGLLLQAASPSGSGSWSRWSRCSWPCTRSCVAALSFVLVAIHCLLILRLYRERNDGPGRDLPGARSRAFRAGRGRSPGVGRSCVTGRIAGSGLAGRLRGALRRRLAAVRRARHRGRDAHKGFSQAAPENSLSAIRKAIEVGADFAEIDVQETSDGEIVLNHDRDLMRVAGVPTEDRRDDPRRGPRGRHRHASSSPEFAGETDPHAGGGDRAWRRDRIKVQIELKFYGKDRKLARDVARLVAARAVRVPVRGLVAPLRRAHGGPPRQPAAPTAAIVTVAIGDIDRLDVDGLSVNARKLTNRLIRAVAVPAQGALRLDGGRPAARWSRSWSGASRTS